MIKLLHSLLYILAVNIGHSYICNYANMRRSTAYKAVDETDRYLETQDEDKEFTLGDNIWGTEFKQIPRSDFFEENEPDYATMQPDDPRFLDFEWITRAGPKMDAFVRHIRWKRSLSDGERLRWQKWAVYKRTEPKGSFEYSVDDYVYQNYLKKLYVLESNAASNNNQVEALLWRHALSKSLGKEETEIRCVVKAYYTALNRQNFDDTRILWLPSEYAELSLPGYTKSVSVHCLFFVYAY